MAEITNLIIHCSDSPFGCVNVIREWHLAKGWKDIGYHFVIMNGVPWNADKYLLSLDGCIECGRYLDGDNFIKDNEVGAHCLGYNDKSIGICVVGPHPQVQPQKFQQRIAPDIVIAAETPAGFSQLQIRNLTSLCVDLIDQHNLKVDSVLGHYETDSGKAEGKTCPDFKMDVFRDKFLRPFFK